MLTEQGASRLRPKYTYEEALILPTELVYWYVWETGRPRMAKKRYKPKEIVSMPRSIERALVTASTPS